MANPPSALLDLAQRIQSREAMSSTVSAALRSTMPVAGCRTLRVDGQDRFRRHVRSQQEFRWWVAQARADPPLHGTHASWRRIPAIGLRSSRFRPVELSHVSPLRHNSRFPWSEHCSFRRIEVFDLPCLRPFSPVIWCFVVSRPWGSGSNDRLWSLRFPWSEGLPVGRVSHC